jgi:glycosyltransferase involved in cell wall biosynthesis
VAGLEGAGRPAPGVSIVLCSRDRAAQLARALDRLPVDGLRRHGVELVLVDSASQDDTPALMQRRAAALGCVTNVVSVPAPGLGRARNAGIARARGELLVFTDDDCYLAPDYLDVLAARFDAARFGYGGGRILRFDPDDADYGVQTRERFEAIAPGVRLPTGRIQGSNMFVHRRVFDRVGGFRDDFGPGTPFRGDDVELLARASLAGFAGAFVPELVVYHHHGRKPGAQLARWMRQDDVARGAYYAAMIAGGHYAYLGDWLRRSLPRRRRRRDGRLLERLGCELAGAARYSLAALSRGVRGSRTGAVGQLPRRIHSSAETDVPSRSTTRRMPWVSNQMRRNSDCRLPRNSA